MHERFNFNSLDEIRKKSKSLGLEIEFNDDLSPLSKEIQIGHLKAANAFAVHPMEGCDSEADGSPSELVKRRYMRLAKGNYGLIWWEANAVVREGKANEQQMMLTEQNIKQFANLLKETRAVSKNDFGHESVSVLQLTHSGRYSRPNGHKGSPMIPQRDPVLDVRSGVNDDTVVLNDEYLESLIPLYVKAACLAREAGFDGVDIKSCHRYLLSELLACYNREGVYGGSYENRTKLLFDIIREVRKTCGDDFIMACRFNVFDAHPYPYGFGQDKEDFLKYDPAEPIRLVQDLCAAGVSLLSNSAGNPYYIYPQVTRPFDKSSMGVPIPKEHPLESIARLFELNKIVQKAAGNIPVVGNGYTWLRQFIPYAGAANITSGVCSFVGLGRSVFAYPDLPADLFRTGTVNSEKCCITCSKCTQIMRDHGTAGCVMRDSEVYHPIYKNFRSEAEIRSAKA